MPFLYVAQSETLNRAFPRFHDQPSVGYLVKMGYSRKLERRVLGLRGELAIDGNKQAEKYAAQSDWRMWRCRWVRNGSEESLKDEERALFRYYASARVSSRREFHGCIEELSQRNTKRVELFLFNSVDQDFARTFPYLAARHMPPDTHDEFSQSNCEPLPNRQRPQHLDDLRAQMEFMRK